MYEDDNVVVITFPIENGGVEIERVECLLRPLEIKSPQQILSAIPFD